MSLSPTNQQLERLSRSLLDAFNHSELKQMVRMDLDENLEWFTPVHGQRDLTAVVDYLVQYYAAKENGIHSLLDAAHKRNPTNPELAELADDWADLKFSAIPLPEDHPSIVIESAQASGRRFAILLAMSVGLIVIAALILWIIRPVSPTRMADGQFNIAAAEFNTTDSEGKPFDSPEARELAQGIANFLTTEQDALAAVVGQKVEIWGPDQGIEPVESGDAAQRAQELNTHVLLYGAIQADSEQEWTIRPELYLADPAVGQADELRGEYALGTKISYNPEMSVSKRDVNTTMQMRLEALTQLLNGLSYMSGGTIDNYRKASTVFQEAVDTSKWAQAADGTGQEILYLFLGNSYLAQTSLPDIPQPEKFELLDQSLDAFEMAQDLNPDYARAFNGLGSTYFAQALNLPTAESECDWDEVQAIDFLDNARTAFGSAIDAPLQNKPPSGQVDFRAHFGLGRVNFWYGYCIDQNLDSWENATAEYLQALEEYASISDPTDHAIDLAASANSELGAIEMFTATGSLAEAAKYYEQALDLYGQSGSEEGATQVDEIMPLYLLALCWDGKNKRAIQAYEAYLDQVQDPEEAKLIIIEELDWDDPGLALDCLAIH